MCSSYLKKLKQVSDFLRGFIDEDIFEPRLEKHTLNKKIKQEEQGNKKLETKMESLLDDDFDYLDTIVIEYLAKEASMSLADYKVGFADLLAGHAAVTNILLRCLGFLSLDINTQESKFDFVKYQCFKVKAR